MIRGLIQDVLSHELRQYGRDAAGNFIVSSGSLKEIAEKVTATVHASITRPVVTVSQPEIMMLAEKAGFTPAQYENNDGIKVQLLLPRGTADVYPQIDRLVDLTIQHVLETIARRTEPEKPA